MMKVPVSATICLVAFACTAQVFAQGMGSIGGAVHSPYDGLVKYAPIQATNIETGEKRRTASGQDGLYEFSNLPTGTYTLRVNMPCCAYKSFTSEEVAVAAATSFDIHLEEGSSFNTVGDDPGVIAAAIKERQIIPDEPPPQMPDGKPDLSGVWLVGSDPFREPADALPWAQELRDKRVANSFRHHPHTYCLPSNLPIPGGAAPFIAKFVQKDDLLVILLEDTPGYRQVFLDGRDHPEWPNPSWMGHSIGQWEGGTLVIDTVGFNDRGWSSGYPQSEERHTIERYTRTEYGQMEVQFIVEDPKVFNSPWEENMVFDLAPQEELIEFVCENNKWAQSAADE
jgi:hypothetical protein